MTTRFVLLAGVAALLQACSAMPENNVALDQARSRYEVARLNPQVGSLAADELKRADLALRTAQQALTDGQPSTEVDHLAYLTSQRVTIAQDSASSRADLAVTEGAGAERDKMRLALRTREADATRQQLTMSQQANATKTVELAAADSMARREQARSARSDARVSDLETQLKDLNAKKTDRGIVVTLGDVLFDTGHWQLLPQAGRDMAKLAGVFQNDPLRRATIEGYTDSVGGAQANYLLSERRANAVMGELVKLGVSPAHLTIRAHGADEPVASNGTAAGRQLNRRVEILFTPMVDGTPGK